MTRAGIFLALLASVACTDNHASAPPARAADSTSLAGGEPAPLAPVLSRFDVPLTWEFTDMIRTLERVVPKSFGSLDSTHQAGGDDRKHFAFAATRGALSVFVHGSEVHMRTTFSYAARGYYKPPVLPTLSAGCGSGDTRPRIIAELVAPLTLTPGWHLRTKARIAKLEPQSDDDRDKCRISFLSIDVTKAVIDAARSGLEQQLAEIDAKVGAVDLTQDATGWWTSINHPIRVAEGVWLLLQPRQLRLKGFTGERHVLHVAAGLDAFPVIVSGARPERVVPPLPPLGHDSGSTGFRVSIEGTVDYATASHVLTSELRGKEVTLGKHTLRVRALAAARNPAGRLVLSVAFTGDAVGTLQLVGTPRFNPATQRIDVNDLDFDLKTDSRMINAYAWLRSDALLTFFRDKTRLPFAPVLAQGGRVIEQGIDQTIDGVLTLAATVDSLVVLGVYVTPRGLTVRALVVGKGSVGVGPRPLSAPR